MLKKIRYLSGYSALAISEGFYDMAFVVMAYRISGQASTAAVAYALGYLAEIIVSLALGGFLDNFDRKKLFTYTIALKSLLFLGIMTYSSFSALGVFAIWCFAFCADLLHHVSRTANTISLFQIFGDKDKASMQGAVICISGILRIAGPLLAAGVIGVVDNPSYLLLSCLLLQAISVWALRELLPNNVEQCEVQPTFFENMTSSSKALREALQSKKWRWFFLTDALATLFIGTLTLMLYPMLRQVHGATESQAGFYMGLAAIGTIVIGLSFQRILESFKAISAAKLGLLIAGSFAIALSISAGQSTLVVCLIAFQCGSTLFFRSMGMYLQDEVPEEQLGSWWTASDAFARIFGLLGVLLGGYVFDFVGGIFFCVALGGCMLLGVAGFYLTPAELKKSTHVLAAAD